MFKKLKAYLASRSPDNLYRINGAVPFKTAIFCGLQHILAMFVANITPIIIVFGNASIGGDIELETAIISAIFVAGVGTLIQLFSIWRIGARLPIVVGISFTFVGVLSTVAVQYGIGTMIGSTLVGGGIIMILGFFAQYWRKFVKPIVLAIVILAIGLSLIPVGIKQLLGTNTLSNFDIGSTWPFLVVGFITLVSYIIFANLFKNWVKNTAIILAIGIGYLVSLVFHFSGVATFFDFTTLEVTSALDVINVPRLIDFGILRFDFGAIAITTIIYIVAATEAMGDVSALTHICENREATNKEISGAIVGDGLISSLSAIFGALPITTFSQNVGVIKETKICNRMTIFFGALFLLLFSFFPILAKVIITIPEPVLGGCMIILFTSIVIAGLEMIAKLGFSKKNSLILCLALGIGYGLSLLSLDTNIAVFFNSLGYVGIIISNPVPTMFLISLVLSLVIKETPPVAPVEASLS
ncbi:MAG: purine/pyrimidine permease [Erysipelotrichaceae bacterium]|jgi:NCS2 family nucleobase:cation symporter-2|nr:purine/pyrimidine permease [Erysipelotrichaceae bacterium]